MAELKHTYLTYSRRARRAAELIADASTDYYENIGGYIRLMPGYVDTAAPYAARVIAAIMDAGSAEELKAAAGRAYGVRIRVMYREETAEQFEALIIELAGIRAEITGCNALGIPELRDDQSWT